MSNKKNHKKHSSPIKTREQLMAEEKARKDAEKKKRAIAWMITAIVAAVLVAVFVVFVIIIPNAKKAPGFKANGKVKDTVYVKMTVEGYGDIILKLDGKEAPITVANFVSLVNEGFYDGLTFHRVINDFMIQGGDPKANGTGGSPNKIKGEFEDNGYHNCIAHERGVISMARSDDYDSASSQFFICNATNDSVSNLDGSYAAFGYVISGMDVVDLITTKTAILAGDSNGTIKNKSDQAVISRVVVISEEEALNYGN